MKMKLLIGSTLLAALAMPLAAQARGVPGGAAHGFYEGNRIAGPVGAVVGTAPAASKACSASTSATM
jgi:hypothetical protein